MSTNKPRATVSQYDLQFWDMLNAYAGKDNITQAKIGNIIGKTAQQVAKCQSGKNRLGFGDAVKIMYAYKVKTLSLEEDEMLCLANF